MFNRRKVDKGGSTGCKKECIQAMLDRRDAVMQ